jgi:hypothetical protein
LAPELRDPTYKKEKTKMKILWPAINILIAIALSACSGGSSSGGAITNTADTMTVTISGPSGTVTKTYTEGSYNSQGNLDPDLTSYITASNNTQIELHSGGSNTPGSTIINISVEGNTAQLYPTGIANPANSILYEIYDTHYNSYTSLFSSTSGTITLSTVGNVGGKITGTFDAVVSLLTNTADTLTISGTFNVTRHN